MYQPCLVEQREAIEKLLGEDAHEGCAQSSELVLLDELIQVDTQQLKDQTQMLSVDEGIF